MRYLLLHLCLLGNAFLFASTVGPHKAELLLENALERIKIGDFDSLFTLHEQIQQVAKQQDDLLIWMNACKETSLSLHYDYGQTLLAVEYLKKTSLEKLWRMPQNAEEWDKLVSVYVNLAFIENQSLNDLRSARNSFETALWIYDEKLQLEDNYVAEWILIPLGNLHNKLGDYNAAEVFLKRGKKIAEQEKNWDLVVAASSDLVILYHNMQAYEKGIAICKEGLSYSNIELIDQGLLYTSYARLLFDLGDIEQARTYNHQAYQKFTEAYEQANKNQVKRALISRALALQLVADFNLEEGYFEKGEENIAAAEQLMRECFKRDKNRYYAKFYVFKAKFYNAWGKYDQVLNFAQKALKSLIPDFNLENEIENPSIEQLYAENTIQEALVYKAEALANMAEAKKDVQLYIKALECHDLIFEVEKQLRRTQAYESSKLMVLEESRERSERAIEMALRIWEMTENPKYKEKALTFAERSKSILLLEAFRKVEAAQLAGIPDSLFEQERKMQAEITLLEKRLFDLREGDGTLASIQQMEEKLLNLKQNYSDWIVQLETQYPQYYNLKYNFETPSLDDIRASLIVSDQAVVEYFVGQRMIYVFYLTASEFEVYSLEKDFPLEEWVSTFRNDIEQFQFESSDRQALLTSYNHLALQLYNKLLKPIPTLPEQVCIIPSGVLTYLPFEALLKTQPTKIRDFRTYPYLIKEHNFSYAYSISLQQSLREREVNGVHYGGFAPSFDGSNGFASLDFNQNAVQSAAKQLKGEVNLGKEATKDRFQQVAKNYQLIQLATHAIANTESGDFSYIVFADEMGGYDSLFVKDVYLLELSADLVMLSACETAVGTFVQGEGIINLARAFFYAGTKSVVTTLWSINEEANERISSRFYSCLKNGESKKSALRESKLQYLHQSEAHYAHPVYWAAFMPIGDMGVVYQKSNLAWWIGSILAMCVLIGMCFYPFKMRSRLATLLVR